MPRTARPRSARASAAIAQRRHHRTDRQSNAFLLDVDQRRENECEQPKIDPRIAAAIEAIERARGMPGGKRRRHRDRGLAIGRKVIARIESGIERGREQQAERRERPARHGAIVAGHHPREQQTRRQLQDDVEIDHRAGRKAGRHEARDETGELHVVRRAGDEGMRRRPRIGREETVIVEIGGVGQQVEPGVRETRPRTRHQRDQRQSDREHAADRAPFVTAEPGARPKLRDDAKRGQGESRHAHACFGREPPRRQHQHARAPAREQRRFRRRASAGRQPADADHDEAGEDHAGPAGKIER